MNASTKKYDASTIMTAAELDALENTPQRISDKRILGMLDYIGPMTDEEITERLEQDVAQEIYGLRRRNLIENRTSGLVGVWTITDHGRGFLRFMGGA